MKKDYKIYYYQTTENEEGKLERITYYFIQLETIILKVRCLSCNIQEGKVTVMRPDIGYITSLNFTENNEDSLVKELLEKVDMSGGPNVNYLLKNAEYELGRISEEG